MATREITRGAMEFDVDGVGPDACLVHQYRQVSTRQPIAEALLPRLRVHAVNPVGLDSPDVDLGMTAFADDLAEFHATAALPPWVMVGGSTGGMVALLHTLRHPQRVRGLILVGTAASHRFTTGSLADPAHPRAAEAAAAHALLDGGPEGAAAYRAAMFRLSVADPHRSTPPPADRDGTTSTPRLQSFLTELDSFDLEPQLPAINCPTLILVGKHDPQCPLPNSERIAAAIPGAQLVVFDRSGHYPYLEEAELFERVVGEWVEEQLTG
ncbi:alpha/beta fold hydrolase [Nocardia terpenica]|uniref:alpha/beta fold hydrolase n=1 Tax=Nocardia terpenica TaxID=455432 RepID=UPI000316FF1A|nr:alpha/beta hydrolase [Nocardia terpenica]NQE90261.1 alpha/beta hydrolase [Nocardia terpenica]